MRKALELSTTTAPAATAFGVQVLEVPPPADAKTKSTPANASSLTASTIKSFAQSLRMMGLSKELVENDDTATKREAYYVSKNWGDARFSEQPESDTVMDDIEARYSSVPHQA